MSIANELALDRPTRPASISVALGEDAFTRRRITLLAVGVVLSLLLFALLSAGGFGAGVMAIQSGNAAQMAQTLLSGLFLSAVFATIVAGFGIDAAFSDADLRRYPLRSLERFTARHILGLADPYWCFVLALETGLVAGLHAYGSFSLWNGAVGAILLLMNSYLLTHVLSAWINRLMTMGSRYLVAPRWNTPQTRPESAVPRSFCGG